MHSLVRTFVLSTAIYAALAGLWAFSSPISSVPDEPAHMIRAAAVVDGQIVTPAWPEFPAFGGVDVPEYVANTANATCFAFQPSITPDCAPADLLSAERTDLVLTGTSAALNSPVYYYLVGWPTMVLSGEAALYGMRAANVAVFAVLMGLTFTQAMRIAPGGRWTVTSFAVASTPMLTYLGGSVNPNGVEAAGALAVYLLVLSSLTRPPTGLWRLASPVVIAAVAGIVVNTRSIGFLWVAIAILVAVTQTGWRNFFDQCRTRWMQAVLAVSGATIVASLVWFTQLPDYDQSIIPTNPTTPVGAFMRSFFGVFQHGDGLIGSFGWLDTNAPAFTLAVFGGAILALVLFAWLSGSGVFRWAPVFFAGLLMVVPAVVQTAIAEELGYIWQGRYLLAMALCAVVSAGLVLDQSVTEDRVSRPQTLQLITLMTLGLAHVITFVHVAKRYVVGADDGYTQMITAPDWQPPGGWILLTALYALVIATAIVAAMRATASASPVGAAPVVADARTAS